MFLRHPEGWGSPHFFFVLFFPCCTPSPIAGPLHPELVARRADPGAGSIRPGSAGCLRLPHEVLTPRDVPSPPGERPSPQSSCRGSSDGAVAREGAREGAWTTPSPALLFGFGCGEAKVWHPQKAQRSGNIQSMQQAGRLEARHTEPALPRSPPPTAHQCAPAWRGGVGRPERPHQRLSKVLRLSQTPH